MVQKLANPTVTSKANGKKSSRSSGCARLARRTTVRVALGCLFASPWFCVDGAYGQLRTGRESQRQLPESMSTTAGVPRPMIVDPAIDPLPRLPRGDDSKPSKVVSQPVASSTTGIVAVAPALFEETKAPKRVQPRSVATTNQSGASTNQSSVVKTGYSTTATSAESHSMPQHHLHAAEPRVVGSGYAIKRVTPVRVTSASQSLSQDAVEGSIATDSALPSSMDGAIDGTYVHDGVLVDDPTIDCENGNCGGVPSYGSEYPTLNIQIAFLPLFGMDRFTARVEAATFWGSEQNVPSLVRSDEIGIPGSVDYFGGTRDWNQSVQGIRGEFGWKFGAQTCNTLQLRFFDAGAQSLTFDSPTANVPSIVRPYQTPSPLAQAAVSVKEPGISNGAVLAHGSSEVSGGDLLFRKIWLQNCDVTTEWIAGYQQARLTDSIDVHSTTFPIGTSNRLELRDQFFTRNAFHGATLGVARQWQSPRWSLHGMFKLGLGNMERNVTISGFQQVNNAVPTTNGLLARSTNNGTYNSETFVVSPEANVTLGYRLTQNLEATVGYNYLGLPKVARAGEQIDTVANLDSTNPARPAFALQESNYSLHSLNYGLQYRY